MNGWTITFPLSREFLAKRSHTSSGPWNLLSSSNNFTTYLSSYSVFLSSIAGVVICDYYLVRRGHLTLKHLYSARKSSPYFYHLGISWRAYAAYLCGIVVNVLGFADAVGAEKVPVGAVYIYRVNFFAGCGVAMAVYWVLCWIWPVGGVSRTWCEDGEQEDSDREGSVAYRDARTASFEDERNSPRARKGGGEDEEKRG